MGSVCWLLAMLSAIVKVVGGSSDHPSLSALMQEMECSRRLSLLTTKPKEAARVGLCTTHRIWSGEGE